MICITYAHHGHTGDDIELIATLELEDRVGWDSHYLIVSMDRQRLLGVVEFQSGDLRYISLNRPSVHSREDDLYTHDVVFSLLKDFEVSRLVGNLGTSDYEMVFVVCLGLATQRELMATSK